MEKTYSAQETAKILGLCLDSVRRHFRSGKLPGVRVGRTWRIAESQLAQYLGVGPLPSGRSINQPDVPLGGAPDVSKRAESNEVIGPLLRTGAVRQRILAIVHQAAINTDLRLRVTQRLLTDLDDLLCQE